MVASGSEECYSDSLICVPKSCRLLQVGESATCESIAKSASNETNPISLAQLSTWNPNILGACDFLVKDQYICIEAPGGSLVGPPQDDIPDDTGGPVRRGPGSTITLPIIENPDVPPELVQEGIAADCIRYVVANSTAASCWKISNDGQVTQARLFELNPVLGEHGENCGTMIWLEYAYCVATSKDLPTTTSVASSTTSNPPTSTSNPKPTATREGIAANCNKWAIAETGIGCYDMAANAGIELSLFYTWNPILGAAGENCGTEIWLDYYYCTGVSGSTTSKAPTPTSVTPPKPTNTQAGIPASCTKFYEAKTGDSCWQIADDNGIELSLLYSLNPILGAAGEGCGTQLWPEYSYCIATS
ncbi:hypothetical protein VE01_00254 [Pseudogymnoascus verrucosus]|uniref:LysM domain-containing protein n=1 Tax=Pseudogymnoascus verrucosus TaxID=342668 RepID=A0A2P2SWY7_9PEZI|nr:uncharacterized protein VE01_00254 [Pseudogymnoascus verrucosus]OBU01349.2 hypothetical protein VE01_00254 [Pseudogymnoascus verrucosus]